MSETRGPSTEPTWNGVPEEEEIRRLLAEAGPRPPIPESEITQIEARAREEWLRRYDLRKRPAAKRWPWMLAAAAALLAGAGLVWRARVPPAGPDATPVASVERVSGPVRIEAHGAERVALSLPDAAGRAILAGSRLETAPGAPPGRVSLRMVGGASVRLDTGTRIVFRSSELLELDHGAVYVDTGAGPGRGGEVTVDTRAGLFRPVGTQFEVRVEPGASATRLRVREGTVSLSGAAEDASAGAGEELTVQSDGRLARGAVPVGGSEWDWVLEAAPMLDIEGVKLGVFLDWLAREVGWRVEFADAEAASRADTVLHGSIAHLTPPESPGVVLASCGLAHRVEGGRLVVFRPDPTK